MNGILEKFLEMWQYQFMVKALVVGVVLAVFGRTDWGVFGLKAKGDDVDGLSHVGFGLGFTDCDGDWRDATAICVTDSDFGGNFDFAGESEE